MSNTDVNAAPKVAVKSAAEEAAELDLKIKQAQLLREEQMLRKAQLENTNLEFQIEQLQGKKDTREGEMHVRAVGLEASNTDELIGHSVCTHKKGGSLRQYPRGDGDKGGYAIMRHRLPSGDMFIRCLRCGKEWLPPVKPVADDPIYKNKIGQFNEGEFRKATDLFKMKMED
jgi:hypothetical protein